MHLFIDEFFLGVGEMSGLKIFLGFLFLAIIIIMMIIIISIVFFFLGLLVFDSLLNLPNAYLLNSGFILKF